MKIFTRRNLAAYLGLSLGSLVACSAWVDTKLAERKFFWTDEGFAQSTTCSQTYTDLFLHGGQGQCSPAPLYYVVQKLAIGALGADKSVLIKFRVLSLFSAAACIGLLLFVLSRYLGYAAAVFACFLLISQPIFHQFAAEDRPYMLWTALFTALIFASVVLVNNGRKPRKIEWLLLAFLSLGLSAVSGAGMLQVSGILFVLLISPSIRNWKLGVREALTLRSTLRPAYLIAFLSISIGLFYSNSSCGWWSGGNNLLETRDPQLVLNVLMLFFPKGSLATVFINLVVVLGMVSTFAYLMVPKLVDRRGKSLSVLLGLQVGIQLVVAIVIGVLVALKGYFFIQRVFIFLIICRSIFGALGLYVLVEWLLDRIPADSSLRTGVNAAAGAVVVVLFFVKLKGMDAYLSESYPFPKWKSPPAGICEALAGKKIVIAVEPSTSATVVSNLVAGAWAVLSDCPRVGGRNVLSESYLVVASGPDGLDFRIKEPPLGSAYVEVVRCSQRVVGSL